MNPYARRSRETEDQPPSLFRINGIECIGAGGIYHAPVRCSLGRRIFVANGDGSFDSVAFEGPFPVRRKQFKSADTATTFTLRNRTGGKVFGPLGYGGDPIWTGGHSHPSVAQERFLEYAATALGLSISWIDPPERSATKGQFMDLVTLLYFLLYPVKVFGAEEILSCCEVMGSSGASVRDAVEDGMTGEAYPFAKAIILRNGKVLVDVDSKPDTDPSRIETMSEPEFLSRIACDLRDRILSAGKS